MMTTKKILHVDMDGVLADLWTKLCELHPEVGAMEDGNTNGYIDMLLETKCPGVFEHLDPIPGAIEAFKMLAEVYDVWILSCPSWVAPLSYTHKRLWVERYLGEAAKKRLILSHNKGIVKGDYLIDDRTAHGVDNFEGEHIHFRKGAFPDWEAVIKYLKQKDNW